MRLRLHPASGQIVSPLSSAVERAALAVILGYRSGQNTNPADWVQVTIGICRDCCAFTYQLSSCPLTTAGIAFSYCFPPGREHCNRRMP